MLNIILSRSSIFRHLQCPIPQIKFVTPVFFLVYIYICRVNSKFRIAAPFIFNLMQHKRFKEF